MHKLSRRDALRGTGVAALAAGVAVVPFAAKAAIGDDVDLIRLGNKCLAAIPLARRLERASRKKYEKCIEGFPNGWGLSDDHSAEFFRRSEATGYDVAADRWNEASQSLDRNVLRMSKLPAQTNAGLAIKASVLHAVMKTWDMLEPWDHVLTWDKLHLSLLDDLRTEKAA